MILPRNKGGKEVVVYVWPASLPEITDMDTRYALQILTTVQFENGREVTKKVQFFRSGSNIHLFVLLYCFRISHLILTFELLLENIE